MHRLHVIAIAALLSFAAHSTTAQTTNPPPDLAQHVPDNATLLTKPTTLFPQGVWRDDYGVGNGAPPVFYIPSVSACSLNSGAGDNGSQVASADGKCWIAKFASTGASPMEWGTVGNGTTDDTAKLQAAFVWEDTASVPLVFDKTHLFLISATLTSSGTPTILFMAGPLGVYASTCQAGIIVNSDITAMSFTGPGGRVEYPCVQMASAANTRTGGDAIDIGGTSTAGQAQFRLIGPTIINPYNGIMVGGPTTGSPSQTNSDYVESPVIVNPVHIGIGNGLNSTAVSTVATVIENPAISCGATHTTGIGIAIFDGDVTIDTNNNPPYYCNIGTEFVPGASQSVGGTMNGGFGDSSHTHDGLIEPANSQGTIEFLQSNNAWASALTPETSLLIDNPNGGNLADLQFVNLTAHCGTYEGNDNPPVNQTVPVVDIEAGNVVTFSNTHITTYGGGNCTTAIKVNTNPASGGAGNTAQWAQNVSLNVNLSNVWGTFTNGVEIIGGAANGPGGGPVTITGGSLADASTPVNYTPSNSGDRITIGNLAGVSDATCTVASASSITIPASCAIVHLTGSVNIQTVAGWWQNRLVYVVSDSGLSLSTGGSPGFCGAGVTLIGGQMDTWIWYESGDCILHTP